ncbi:hypothetical protein SAMN05661008_00645 [Alkalithermobacter thermoalcaliphilus JW-YL-7 = DSM 7308]|uniref:Uncharacterized protein n=1 Tax=Alkalithermobacter thermoalcaliphilus JW-YL-7 = DSM 7308 TaxID=1121328 RepID=A0A150FQ35_CLOPD|nr:hypothetical protein JWYL7_0753 [[Clostridium] paradoxum JW-YL-7 = DSM 7308]SHK64980.1 hypothetical protein SAMN05661008_00645 [[Clostridium] paradoxum JW-YL-7 = DSM 7308]
MEGIIFIIVMAVINAFLGKDKKENKKSLFEQLNINDIFENVKNNIDAVNQEIQPEKIETLNIEKIYKNTKEDVKPDKVICYKQEKVDKNDSNKKVLKDTQQDTKQDDFDLFSDLDSLKKGIILSEILSKPKSLR